MSTFTRILVTAALACLAAQLARAEPPPAPATQPTVAADLPPLTPPAELQAMDKPNDNGSAVMLTWKKMSYEAPDVFYEVLMSDKPEGPFWPQGLLSSQYRTTGPYVQLKSEFPGVFGDSRQHIEAHEILGRYDRSDWWGKCPCPNCRYHAVQISRYTHPDPANPEKIVGEAMVRGKMYYFQVQVVRGGELAQTSGPAVSAAPLDNWFFWNKLNLLMAMVVLSTIIMTCALIAKRNPHKLFIRRIAGLEAVDDALGRAAEMGKPVFFCHGPGSLSDVVTISAINLLGKVAERVGEYGINMKVTCLDYMVMQVSQEMVRDAYTRVGRPDAYKDDNVFFVSGNTFAYSAAVSGMMIRERAGTAFFFGRFSSESLLLSETGAITKAIQIAGTDSFTQIPFFITTCDYTLIGEEMYAGSAYLSREPRLVGAVKGQDATKLIIMTLVVVGSVLTSVGVVWFARLFWPLI